MRLFLPWFGVPFFLQNRIGARILKPWGMVSVKKGPGER
jgi:hypothetical protein